MEDRWIVWLIALETLAAAGFYLMLPWITRRGLLFGVYVGEEAAAGEAARRLTRTWRSAMLAATVVSLGVGIGATLATGRPLASITSLFLFLAASFGLYLWAYRTARALAPAAPPPAPAVAMLGDEDRGSWLPHVTLAFAVACGLLGLAHAAVSCPALPERIPTHFGLTGGPDAWSPRSFASVFLLPVLALVQGIGMGLLCLFVPQAKRAVRLGDGGASLAAQHAFRRAMTRFLCAITAIVAVLLLSIGVYAVRTGLGQASGIPVWVLGLEALLLLVALGGAVVLAVRYGQGGARLERGSGAAAAPLTDGLADNRHWVLGMFYVNREDPSVLVEHRFGLGYTINLGNWKAVAVLGGFLAVMLGITVLALVAIE